MKTRRILRYEVPVDGRWHRIDGALAPLHVGCRKTEVVEFRAWERPDDPTPADYRIYGTGHPIDADTVQYVGTTPDADNRLIWHLVRRKP